jgi:hypothetical protein
LSPFLELVILSPELASSWLVLAARLWLMIEAASLPVLSLCAELLSV